jgi:integrase
MAGLYKLTDKFIRGNPKPGRHSDGGGLYLFVDGKGRRWCFLFKWKDDRSQPGRGRQREMGLGSLDVVSLARARELAAQAREHVAAGRDPILHRRLASRPEPSPEVVTFGRAADAYVASQEPGWKNDKHKARWRRVIGDHHCRPIRSKPVQDVDLEDVLAILTPLWTTKPDTAKRVRGGIEIVLDYARVRGWRSGENPARWRGHLKLMLPKRPKLIRGHHRALPWQEMPAFMCRLRGRPQSMSSLALEFTILTIARTHMTIAAPWTEIDRKAQLWVIPPARMKEGHSGDDPRPHRVPLTPRMLEILEVTEKFGSEWVFSGQGRNGHLSSAAMAELLKEMDVDATVHGFRSTFRDWAGDATEHPREVAEAALSHVVGDDAERAYRRGDALERRRRMMMDWEAYCASGASGPVAQAQAAPAPAALAPAERRSPVF